MYFLLLQFFLNSALRNQIFVLNYEENFLNSLTKLTSFLNELGLKRRNKMKKMSCSREDAYEDRQRIGEEKMLSVPKMMKLRKFNENLLGLSKTVSTKIAVHNPFMGDKEKKSNLIFQIEAKLQELKNYITQKIDEKNSIVEKPKYLRDILKNMKKPSIKRSRGKSCESTTEKIAHKTLLSMLDISLVKSNLLLIQDLSKSSNIQDIVFYTAKMRADFLISRGYSEFNIAFKIYNGLRIYSVMIDCIKKQLIMYEQCGYMNRLRKNHKIAIEMFKRMLQSAWILKKTQEELKAYHHLSLEYYYLEELNKSRYYLEKYLKGNIEKDNSIIKQIYLQEYKIKKVKYHVPQDLDVQELKDDILKNSLTSPSEGRHKIDKKANDYSINHSQSQAYTDSCSSPVGVTRKYKFLNIKSICARSDLGKKDQSKRRFFSRPPKVTVKNNTEYFLDEKKKNQKKANKNIYSRKIMNARTKSFHDIVQQAASRSHLSPDKSDRAETRADFVSNWTHDSTMRTKFTQDGIKELLANIEFLFDILQAEKMKLKERLLINIKGPQKDDKNT
ncbi:unnamed protein product [Moneuplotes crassus]|uniref:Uncharacterized protein n=1 Tax=Euplotes crassus TaxID=5936 RepID=A0AAD1XZ09_EUPCR|nr:unnamed protein product [Moneuplotes crassus]